MSSDTKPPAVDVKLVDEWIDEQDFQTTADIKIPEKLADQVIGQDSAVEVIKKAAEQKRHVMLIGEPGTGKSMLAKSMTEFLPKGELQDIIAYHNAEDPNEPKVRVVPAGKGKEIVAAQKKEAMAKKQQKASIVTTVIVVLLMMTVAMYLYTQDTSIILVGIIAVAILFFAMRYSSSGRQENYLVPKLRVGHDDAENSPFIDATGARRRLPAWRREARPVPERRAGDPGPRASGGRRHPQVRPTGVLVHRRDQHAPHWRASRACLPPFREGKFSITGQSERSSGAMVKSEPVPCDFILVCAGNLDAMQGMHPALRSRIRGYGYEVFMRSTMEDTDANRNKLIRFVAQEVARDKKIPHFDKRAVGEIVKEAQRRAGRHGLLTLRLRELGGLVRVAGDVAREKQQPLVTGEMVLEAKRIARSLEQQIADRYLESSKDYQTFTVVGESVGTVNGLAALNANSNMSEFSGIVLPIVAEVTPPQTRSGGRVIATGKLGEIAKEAVQNVSALIKKYTGEDIANHDVHIQFVGTYEGVEGDSASISVATAVISALENVPVDQNLAMTGSLSVRGQVLPVGGVTAKIEAASEAGIKRVIIPRANLRDVVLDKQYVGKIEIIPVETLGEVLEKALIGGPNKDSLLRKLSELGGAQRWASPSLAGPPPGPRKPLHHSFLF